MTPSSIADEMGVTRTAVTGVIAGRSKSKRIQKRIAALINKPVHAIWPTESVSGLRRAKKGGKA